MYVCWLNVLWQFHHGMNFPHLHYLRLIEILWMLTMCLGEVLYEITECSAWTILLQQCFILYPLQVIGVENVFTHFSLFISFNKLYFIVCVHAMSVMLLCAIIPKASQPSKTRVRQNEKKGRIWIPISR